MEPIEINAGGFYLRALRADDLLDDRPAILCAFSDAEMRRWVADYRIADLADAGDYVRRRAREWDTGTRCSWAVAEPTTGELLGEVDLRGLDEGDPQAACWTHPGHRGRGVASTALGAAVRFGFGALELDRIGYQHDAGNTASRRVAEKCGFELTGESTHLGARLLHWVAVA
ncbi:GNAT family N-acetyltransferase [Kibdelosporangium phytohabitans]|uniref:GCN5 family acetyltransferase n=1 Tax=Kibdelosporangium phytohabitans TaxID=860235 RepID=A0A0N9I4A9_9PSEU|nr:GNAT family N-acetyltransferase [Kibdelosporangium phytohabitans]ALG13658.1 GCN5 family acetyltransferase [Kibdelosporangium phytohabitans]MBE1465543.1 RimJ/RimL family protein N-acetyltransferase [Kibdelosporangium phytohabitans]